jgi:Tol biopolymer transport system component
MHRDVKPSNILVDDSGNVKLLDFGTARLVDATAEAALTKTGVFAFTPEYASPEQVRGEPVAVTSDLYSCAVLLYRLLTGRLPYRIGDPSPAGVAEVIAGAQLQPSKLDAPLDAIVSKALSKTAADRYQSAAEMDADLARYLEGQRVRARKPRKKFWIAIASMLAVAGAGILGWRMLGVPSHQFIPFDAGVPDAMQPALSNDGKLLAFASPGKDGTHPDIWLKPMPKGAAKRVTSGDAANDEPALSPDGRWLAFHSTRAPAGIYLQLASGGAARLLVEGGRSPRFSPDGKWIAYLNNAGMSGDPVAFNASTLYRVPAQGGAPVRLAKTASSVQGLTWGADGSSVLFLALDEQGTLRIWSDPLDGGSAAMLPEFGDTVHLGARACAVTESRFLYAVFGEPQSFLGEFPLIPALRASPHSLTPSPLQLQISDCAASAGGMILADGVDSRSSAWVLPIDAESGTVRGSPAPLTKLEHGPHVVEFTPDGASFLRGEEGARFLQDYRTGWSRPLPAARALSSDGAFVLQASQPEVGRSIFGVLNLKTGETWGRIQTNGVPWDLSSGGRWMLAASREAHRAVVAWDTMTAEHRAVYAHPGANLYLATFAKDGRWVLFTSEEGTRPPHMWAARFRGLQDIPLREWVDLGEGDYPRWSPAGGRIYFTQAHNGLECLFTRAVDQASKRPVGAVTEVQHSDGRLTPGGMYPGTFRLSVAQDKISFALGERVHQLLQWK